MRGYNDDLGNVFCYGFMDKRNCSKIKSRGYRVTKKALSNINAHQGVYTPEEKKTILGYGNMVEAQKTKRVLRVVT